MAACVYGNCINVFTPPCETECGMRAALAGTTIYRGTFVEGEPFSPPEKVELTPAQQSACDAYWSAQSRAEEHRAVQRIMALDLAPWGGDPCPEPECVAVRAEERRKAGLSPGIPSFAAPDIAAITRDVARGT